MKILTTLSLVFLSQITFAQNRITDTSATCIAFWKKGDYKIYKVTRTREKNNSSNIKSVTSGSYETHIKIIDSTNNGYIIEWTNKNFKGQNAEKEILANLNAVLEGMKIIYKTDDVGTFVELVNWKEVRDFAFISLENLIKKASEKEIINSINQIKPYFQTKESIETFLIKEIQLYHTPYGAEYNFKGSPTATELPNAFGGNPFPATIIPKLEEINTTKDYCKVTLNQTVDKGKAGAIMAEMLLKISKKAVEDEVEMRKQIKDLEFSDTNEFSFAINSGWHKRIFYSRKTNVGSTKQVESLEIIISD